MKETIKVEKKNEILSLVTGISYSNVSSWYGASRRDLKMDIIMPKNSRNHRLLPCIIWICGGSYMIEDRAVWLPQFVSVARAGYIVASIDYRTSNENHFPAPLVDIKSAVRYLKAHSEEYCVDPDRIFVMGESAGGGLAALAGVTNGNPEFEKGAFLEYDSNVRGVVDFYGISDMPLHIRSKHMRTGTVPYWTIEAFLGKNYTEEQALKASAITYVSENSPPFIMFHGTDDGIILPDQSQLLYDKLTEKGVRAEFVSVEGAHHCDARFYQEEVLERVVEFLNSI